jgi:glycosyltransferase involved in cell wall biosynthesis
LLKHAHAVIATSTNEVKSYKAFGVEASKINLLGHGITIEEFTSTLSQQQARKKLGLPISKTIVTFLGRIHRIKGLDRLAETINELKKNDALHFVIAGSDDGFLTELKELIQTFGITSKISLLGTSFGEAKANLFKASDLFIYPSYSEGFSLGILEAGAAGLPLILSTGCHFDQVAEQQAGLVVKNNPTQLKSAILKLADNNTLRVKYGRNAQQLVSNAYSMAAIGQKLLKLYEKSI